jgi:cytochrome c oxidase cbb3-type subunit IV
VTRAHPMDINILRAAVTLLSFTVFIAIVFWAWSRHRRQDFDEAAQLPFLDGEAVDNPGARK